MEDHGKDVFIADCNTASMTVLRRSLKEVRRSITCGVDLAVANPWIASLRGGHSTTACREGKYASAAVRHQATVPLLKAGKAVWTQYKAAGCTLPGASDTSWRPQLSGSTRTLRICLCCTAAGLGVGAQSCTRWPPGRLGCQATRGFWVGHGGCDQAACLTGHATWCGAQLLTENELLRTELAGLKDSIGRAAELLAADLPGSQLHPDWAVPEDMDPPASPPAVSPSPPAFAPASPQPPARRAGMKRQARDD